MSSRSDGRPSRARSGAVMCRYARPECDVTHIPLRPRMQRSAPVQTTDRAVPWGDFRWESPSYATIPKSNHDCGGQGRRRGRRRRTGRGGHRAPAGSCRPRRRTVCTGIRGRAATGRDRAAVRRPAVARARAAAAFPGAAGDAAPRRPAALRRHAGRCCAGGRSTRPARGTGRQGRSRGNGPPDRGRRTGLGQNCRRRDRPYGTRR